MHPAQPYNSCTCNFTVSHTIFWAPHERTVRSRYGANLICFDDCRLHWNSTKRNFKSLRNRNDFFLLLFIMDKWIYLAISQRDSPAKKHKLFYLSSPTGRNRKISDPQFLHSHQQNFTIIPFTQKYQIQGQNNKIRALRRECFVLD